MDEASKLPEYMTISQPQLPAYYRRPFLNPPIVDGMINMVPSLVSLVDQAVNMVTSLVEPVDKVVNLIPSSFDPTLSLEVEIQVVDLFPSVDPILPLENETQVVDMIPSLVNHTLLLEIKPNTTPIFLIDTKSTVLWGIPPPAEPPQSNEAILFY
jgi:hypothetical protein